MTTFEDLEGLVCSEPECALYAEAFGQFLEEERGMEAERAREYVAAIQASALSVRQLAEATHLLRPDQPSHAPIIAGVTVAAEWVYNMPALVVVIEGNDPPKRQMRNGHAWQSKSPSGTITVGAQWVLDFWSRFSGVTKRTATPKRSKQRDPAK